MSEVLDTIVKKMNDFGNILSENTTKYFKKAINKSEEYASKGVQQIEIEKLKWKLKKYIHDLGKYVYNQSTKNVTDYSEDDQFIILNDKIKRLENLIVEKLKK